MEHCDKELGLYRRGVKLTQCRTDADTSSGSREVASAVAVRTRSLVPH